MGKQRRVAQPRKLENIRERVLETLNELHLDFIELGQLEDAGPLLHELMRIGYSAAVPAGNVVEFEPAPNAQYANGKEE
jgi:hypothetical protein